MTKVEERIFAEISGVVVCTSRVVKMKHHQLFVENSAYFVLEIDLRVV